MFTETPKSVAACAALASCSSLLNTPKLCGCHDSLRCMFVASSQVLMAGCTLHTPLSKRWGQTRQQVVCAGTSYHRQCCSCLSNTALGRRPRIETANSCHAPVSGSPFKHAHALSGCCWTFGGLALDVHAQAQMWQLLMHQQQQAALSAAGGTAYMQQVQAYGLMMGALGVAADGTLLAGQLTRAACWAGVVMQWLIHAHSTSCIRLCGQQHACYWLCWCSNHLHLFYAAQALQC